MSNKIKVIVLPADPTKMVEIVEVEGTFEAYRKIVPGWDAGTTLEECPSLSIPSVTVYIDEESTLDAGMEDYVPADQRRNLRVSILLGHNNRGEGHWGGGLVVGPPDAEGKEQGLTDAQIAAVLFLEREDARWQR